MIWRFLTDEDGATAIEYSVIAAALAVVVLGGMELIGAELANWFTATATLIESVFSDS